MLELQEIEKIRVIPFKKLLRKNAQLRKDDFHFPVVDKLQDLPEKEIAPPEEPELPFDRWTMPRQPQGYIRCRSYEWF